MMHVELSFHMSKVAFILWYSLPCSICAARYTVVCLCVCVQTACYSCSVIK